MISMISKRFHAQAKKIQQLLYEIEFSPRYTQKVSYNYESLPRTLETSYSHEPYNYRCSYYQSGGHGPDDIDVN